MKITMRTTDFKNVAEKMFKALPKKQPLEMLENFCFEVDRDKGLFKIKITDLEMFATAIVKIENHNEIEDTQLILADTNTFVKSLKYFKGEYVMFEFNENEPQEIDIKCGNKTSKVGLLAGECVVFPQVLKESSVQYNAERLKQRVNQVKYAVAKEDYKPVLQGIHFNGTDIVACDGYRLAINVGKDIMLEPVTISFASVKMAIDIFGKEDITIFQDDKYFVIVNEDFEFITRKHEESYIEYKGIVSPDSKYAIKFNRSELVDGLEYLKMISNDKIIKTKIKMNGRTISTHKGMVELNCDNIPITIGYNPTFMLDALKQFEEDHVVIEMTNPTTPMTIRNETDVALVMPIKLKDEKENVA